MGNKDDSTLLINSGQVENQEASFLLTTISFQNTRK